MPSPAHCLDETSPRINVRINHTSRGTHAHKFQSNHAGWGISQGGLLTHSHTHSLAYSLTHSLTHRMTRTLTHSLTESLPYSLACCRYLLHGCSHVRPQALIDAALGDSEGPCYTQQGTGRKAEGVSFVRRLETTHRHREEGTGEEGQKKGQQKKGSIGALQPHLHCCSFHSFLGSGEGVPRLQRTPLAFLTWTVFPAILTCQVSPCSPMFPCAHACPHHACLPHDP